MTATDLRAEARSIADRRPDVIKPLTTEQRRAFLLELAEHVENESRWGHRPFTDVLPTLIPAVSDCPDAVEVFLALVDAVEVRRRFNGDPEGFAAACEASVVQVEGTVEADVEDLLDRLVSA